MAATRDSLWGGRLVLWQPGRGEGYRFNLDPVLLADFARCAERVMDLGTGCGVVGLLLLAGNKATRVVGVEIQADLAAFARRNAEENGVAHRFEVREGDLRQVELPTCDAVVFNPPYFRRHESRPSYDAGRDGGRRERYGELSDFVAAGSRALERGGPLSAIVPAQRLDELCEILRCHDLSIVRQRAVQSRHHSPPRHVLIEARRDVAEPRTVEPPLVVHESEGHGFSPEVQAMLTPTALRP